MLMPAGQMLRVVAERVSVSVWEDRRREQRDAPELDAGRGGGVPADAVGAGDVAALELADLLAVDEPGEGILLPVDLFARPRQFTLFVPPNQLMGAYRVVVVVAERVRQVAVRLARGLLGCLWDIGASRAQAHIDE